MIKYVTDENEKARITREVLEALPEWFGIKESREEYINSSKDMPYWACCSEDCKEDWGFICLKETSKSTVEIYCMGIKKEHHRKGLGKDLWEFARSYARQHGYNYAQVKTVEAGHYKEYDETNRFYKSLGFEELEVFPTLWDENNPCQIYVMSLDGGLFDLM